MSRQDTPPLIGVSGCRKEIGAIEYDCAGRKYSEAVELACRAVPLIVPTAGDALDRRALLERIDGLLFTGSHSNVEPHHYRGRESDRGTLHDPHRDATTLPLIREAVAAGVPVLCICRGFQEINVAYGGSLHQKVHERPAMLDHREDTGLEYGLRYEPVHGIEINPDGMLGRLSGVLAARVNSLHEQGVERLGDGLLCEAKAPDGLIEAVSVIGARAYAVGVQWHPEWNVMDNPFYLSLFRAFGSACREQMDKRRQKV